MAACRTIGAWRVAKQLVGGRVYTADVPMEIVFFSTAGLGSDVSAHHKATDTSTPNVKNNNFHDLLVFVKIPVLII